MNPIHGTIYALLAGFILSVSIFATAAEDKKKDQPQNLKPITAPTVPTAVVSSAPKYKPPVRGAPIVRISGSSRGDSFLSLAVLAPPHTGLTLQEQPSLYWYLSKPVTTHVEATLTDEQTIRPLLEINLDTPIQAGIQRLRLSDYDIKLKPDVKYRWSVALVPDPEQRSNDIIASGMIQRIESSNLLAARLAQASQQDLSFIYADEGLWYDAIAAISKLIESRPNDPILRGQRAYLLEQVELPEAAAHDRKQTSGK